MVSMIRGLSSLWLMRSLAPLQVNTDGTGDIGMTRMMRIFWDDMG